MSNENSNEKGTFYGIGVGPGDPELLTVKAIETIKKVDVIIAPKTEKKEGSVALSIAEPYLQTHVEIIYQTFPMVRHFESSPEIFKENTDEIISFLNCGKNVAFLTLGDPMFFSTYIYVFNILKAEGAKIETVPGVPAFLAIAAGIGRPLAWGNDILTIIPATADKNKIADALKFSDATVLMKVYKNFAEVTDMLTENEMADNAVLVSRFGLQDEKIITNIDEHKHSNINYLSTILTKRNKEIVSTNE